MATHGGPGGHRKKHEGREVAAREVQDLLAYAHDLGFGLICTQTSAFMSCHAGCYLVRMLMPGLENYVLAQFRLHGDAY